MMQINNNDALIVVDMQNDFMPGGALPVPNGGEIISGINDLAHQFRTVVLTKDWHPYNHSSFIENGGTWPKHCVIDTLGADFDLDLYPTINTSTMVLSKGMDKDTESYSGFVDSAGNQSGLRGFLKDRKVERVFIVGVAYEYCVASTALDAAMDFETFIIEDLVRGIDPNAIENVKDNFKLMGGKIKVI